MVESKAKASLLELLLANPDFYKRYIKYPLSEQNVFLSKKHTGFRKEQEIVVEPNISWHPFTCKNKREEDALFIITSGIAMKGLALTGDAGIDNGRSCINECSLLGTNQELGGNGIPLTDILVEKMPAELREIPESYWLVSKCYNGYKYVLNGRVKDTMLKYNGQNRTKVLGIRMIVRLRNDTMIYINDSQTDGNTAENAISIVPNSLII